ncbi:hypothetical protein K1719_014279 [Acacia pycnantha]|nr:hypothetical protein K1719_014279 [Acacia pycnantha]
MGATDVIASVKAKLGKPSSLQPNKGKVSIHVECSPTAEPAFEGRRDEELLWREKFVGIFTLTGCPKDKHLQEGKLAPAVLPKFEDPVATAPPPEQEVIAFVSIWTLS